ncbi:cation transporter [Azospirillum rugosum]|uniref:Co/Zn/Cd efflux system component n=1 Tax=Azospirillum rugosum TaxID=416170 RepID=A0ABS4SHT4_9PROT|nr:cation transporter [Azospirillum rugosum]MBP2292140.1 Co/Zn/Cd efflux system component [Azospirillum rugosum]MDQ0525724.1 Co/Zn/Cd efflux system component [Azospirillum rugosum]
MAGNCCGGSCGGGGGGPGIGRQADYRRVLRMALLINAVMFVIELVASLDAESMALRADALDFLADAANYGVSLWVLGKALEWRSWAAVVKGLSLGAMGLWVVGSTAWNAYAGTLPDAPVMGLVGLLALGANLSVAALLFASRRGDANMRSVWLCSRNDAMANVAVMLAGAGVWTMREGWPDILVAAVIAGLALSAALSILRQAFSELRAYHDSAAGASAAGTGEGA